MATRFISRSTSTAFHEATMRTTHSKPALYKKDFVIFKSLRAFVIGRVYGAEGFAFGRTTFSVRRSGPLAAAGGVAGPPKAADRMSGSSSFAVTSMRVPRGNDSGRSNQ